MNTNFANDSEFVQSEFDINSQQSTRNSSGMVAASERLSQWIYSLQPSLFIEGNSTRGSLVSCRLYDDCGRPVEQLKMVTANAHGRWRIEFLEAVPYNFYRIELETSSTSNLDPSGYFCVDSLHPSYQALEPFSVSDQLIAMK